MATVISRNKDSIDELLGDLVSGLAVVDGNLLVTYKDGTVTNVGGVGNANSVCRLPYTNGAYPSRPSNVLYVEWVGPTTPPQMTNKDTWVQAG